MVTPNFEPVFFADAVAGARTAQSAAAAKSIYFIRDSTSLSDAKTGENAVEHFFGSNPLAYMPQRRKGAVHLRRRKIDRRRSVERVAGGRQCTQCIARGFELTQRGNMRPRQVERLAPPADGGDRLP